MRVTFVLNDVNLSGGIRVVAIYAERLQRRGHRVTVVSRPGRVPSLGTSVKSLLRGRGWPTKPTGDRRSHLDGIARHGVEHRTIESRRPIVDRDLPDADVVVATWWETAPWVAALSPGKGAKAYFVQDFGANSGQPMDRLVATWRLPMHKLVISRYIMDLVRPHCPADEPLEYVPNSVDLELFHAPPRGKQPRPTVGMIYSRSLFKGADLCLKAYDVARRQVPDLHLVGFGLHHRSPDLPVPEGSEFHARLGDDRLREVYGQCDAWLFGPRKEGFGLPVLEAMACRTPVIATPAGAAPELIAQRGGGMLVDHDDPDAMAAAIVRVAAMSDAEWRQMSDAAHATVTGFTWDDATARFEAALEAAMARGGRRDVPVSMAAG